MKPKISFSVNLFGCLVCVCFLFFFFLEGGYFFFFFSRGGCWVVFSNIFEVLKITWNFGDLGCLCHLCLQNCVEQTFDSKEAYVSKNGPFAEEFAHNIKEWIAELETKIGMVLLDILFNCWFVFFL